MKKALVVFLFVCSAAAALAQSKKKLYDGAVDLLNCKIIELVLADADPAVFTAFKSSCNCRENPSYKTIVAAIPARQTKTVRLAKEIQQLKRENLAYRSAEEMTNFLSDKIFDQYARYPAIYAFATKRIESEGFYDMKAELQNLLSDYLQNTRGANSVVSAVYTQAAPDSFATAAAETPTPVTKSRPAVETPATPVTVTETKETDLLIMQERLAALESKEAAGGIVDHTTFQISMVLLLAILFGWVLWKNKGAPLTKDNQEEIKGFIDRKLLSKLQAIQTDKGYSAPPVVSGIPEPASLQAVPAATPVITAVLDRKPAPAASSALSLPAEMDLIFTVTDEMILSRVHRDWRVWQEKFANYRACLSFQAVEELTEFLELEYNFSEANCRLLRQTLAKSKAEFLVMNRKLNDTGALDLQELQVETTR